MFVFRLVLDGNISWRNEIQSAVASCSSKKPWICQESRYLWCFIPTRECT